MKRHFRRAQNHWSSWFYDETYRANLRVIWPVNGKQVSEYINYTFGLTYPVDDFFFAKCVEVTRTNSDCNIICLQEWPAHPTPSHIAALTHECFHAAEHVLSKRGMHLNADTTEAYAYLIESIMRRALILIDTSKRLRPA